MFVVYHIDLLLHIMCIVYCYAPFRVKFLVCITSFKLINDSDIANKINVFTELELIIIIAFITLAVLAAALRIRCYFLNVFI